MRNIVRTLIGAALVLPFIFGAPAMAQPCSGNFAAGNVCGNSGASSKGATSATLTGVFDRAFCSTANSALARISGSWVCLATATSAVWATDGSGVPSLTQTLPNAVQDNITRLGTVTTGGIPGSLLTGTIASAVQDNITHLGTVTSGTWSASTIALNKGGSGATDAASARSNFGIGTIGTQNANSVAITGGSITGMPSPSLISDVATKGYADSIAGGVNPRTAVTWATAAVLPNTPTYANGASGVGATLTAGSNIAIAVDGGAPSLNDRVLVKNQVTTLQNGVYTVTTVGSGGAPWVLTRAADFDAPAEMTAGAAFLVSSGSANIGTGWALAATVSAVGTDPATFNQYQSISGALLAASNLSDVASPSTARTNLGLAIGTNVQAFDSDLSALAANGTNGLWARTASGTGSARTITGTAAEITVSNGDGVSGNPTLSLPTALTFTGKTTTGGTFVSNTFTGADLTAGANIKLNSKWLSNDGGNEGIKVDDSGNVGIGIAPAGVRLQANLAANKNIIFQDAGTSRIAFYNDVLGATINGAIDASQLYLNANTAGVVGVNTTSPNHALDVNGNIGIVAAGYLNWGATDGTTGYGIRDSGGTIQIKNSGGSWANIPTSGVTQWTNCVSLGCIYFNTGGIVIGSTSITANSSMDIIAGTGGSPITTRDHSAQIIRTEAINMLDTQGAQNAALYVISTGNNTSGGGTIAQPVAGLFEASQTGSGDSVGLFSNVSNSGTGTFVAFGAFHQASALTPSVGAVSLGLGTVNNSGVNRGYSAGAGAYFVGVDAPFGGANYGEVAYLARTTGGAGNWDVGYAIYPGAVRTFSFRDDSSSDNILYATGTHINGVDFRSATITNDPWQSNSASLSSGGVWTATSFIPISDERLKTVVGQYTGGLTEITGIDTIRFHWKADPDGPEEVGVSAQQVRTVIPHAVKEKDGILGVDDRPLIAALINSVKELKAANDNLRACQSSWKCRLFGIGD